jgi:uncharacterized protein YjbK
MKKAENENKIPPSSKPNSREIESSLIIISKDPQVTANEIESLSSIDDYQLSSSRSQIIHDSYFDTPNRGLKKYRFALRIREVNGNRFMTLKGPSSLIKGTSMSSRLEIEEKWSKANWNKLIGELDNRGIRLSHPEALTNDNIEFDESNKFKDIMLQYGLEVVQDRNTYRKIKNVVCDLEESNILAELDIDCCEFHFDGNIKYYGVEIESKTRNGLGVVEIVEKALLNKFPSKIRQWKYSKLQTGMAIENLIKTRIELSDDDNNLKPSAFDEIASYIQSSKEG